MRKRIRCRDDEPQMIVYLIRNKINGKGYVGQSITCFRRRYDGSEWWKHVSNDHLENALRKYGYQNFEVLILESNVPSLEQLDVLEKRHIETFGTLTPRGYNYERGGQLDRHEGLSESACDKIASTKTGNKTHKLLNNLTEEIVEFRNISRFCRENNLSDSAVSRVLCGHKNYDHHREWSRPEKPIRKTELTSPSGERFVLLDVVNGGIKAFCKIHNIRTRSAIQSLINGQCKAHKGWTARTLAGESKR